MSLFPENDLVVEYAFGDGSKAAIGLNGNDLELRVSVRLPLMPRNEREWQPLAEKATQALMDVRNEEIPFMVTNESIVREQIRIRKEKP